MRYSGRAGSQLELQGQVMFWETQMQQEHTRAIEPSKPHLEDGNNLKEIGVMVWNEVMLGTFVVISL